MKPSAELLQDVSEKTGFRPGALEKVLRLGDIMADIHRHPLLSECLLLKGGTALNLCFGPPRRLSVDLDFNYVGAVERQEMIERRPAVEVAVQTVAAAQGYAVQLSTEEHAGRKSYLGHTSAAGAADRIELDVNYLFRIPLVEPETRELWQPGDIASPECRTVGHAELWIGKLCALLDRCAPRDLYDAALSSSLEEERLEDATFKSLFLAMAGALNHPLHTYSRKRLERITAAVVEQQLYPMLTGGDRPVVDDLLDAAWDVLGPLLDLNDAEREFIDRLQIGELEPQLLFPEQAEMRELLARHPVLLWKAQNAREHQRGHDRS